VIVIGSGFGGAVAASWLAGAGRSVLVAERGRRLTPETYRENQVTRDAWIWDPDRPHIHNGWIDTRFLTRVGGTRGGCGRLRYGS
jgi:choline dehydrogenase-like flavoprotein